MFAVSKAADLNKLVQGGQLYWAFPFSKTWLSYISIDLLALTTLTDMVQIAAILFVSRCLKVCLHYDENRTNLVRLKEKK
jgi:hypothetical protein